MKSIWAIIAGSAFIVITILLLQLAYIFIAVGYQALAADFPFLNDITGVLRYLVGIPILMLTMFAGGYITASIADRRSALQVWLHCLAVGLLTVGGMMYSATDDYNLTLTGIAVTVLALGASSAGGLYWLRGNRGRSVAGNDGRHDEKTH